MAIFSRSRYTLSRLKPSKCVLYARNCQTESQVVRQNMYESRAVSGFIPSAISRTPGPAPAIGHPNTCKPISHLICATVGIPYRFQPSFGASASHLDCSNISHATFWFEYSPVSTLLTAACSRKSLPRLQLHQMLRGLIWLERTMLEQQL